MKKSKIAPYLITACVFSAVISVGLVLFESGNYVTYQQRLLSNWQHFTDPNYPFMAWALFALLSLAMIFLLFQAWQEQGLVETLGDEFKREQELIQQKNNFVTLSSHYLRTPLTLIRSGIELMPSFKADPARVRHLQLFADQLKTSVDSLLAASSQQPAPAPAPIKLPKSYIRYMLGSVAGAFICISLAVYLLAHIGYYGHQLKHIIMLSALLLVAVMIYSTYRGRLARREVQSYFEQLISYQRALDSGRNQLISRGLQQLKSPIAQIHTELIALGNNRAAKPVAEGTARFEAILQKFTILDGLWAGSIGTIKQPVDLNQVIVNIEHRYDNPLRQKRLSLKRDVRAVTLKSDGLLLEYVINSLVDNAIKYSPEGQAINLSIKKASHKRLILSVGDSGPGISDQKKSLIFKPFSRAEDAATDFEHEGIGLSLYLDRLIMYYLGGVIGIDSRPAKGAIFWLSLPRKT